MLPLQLFLIWVKKFQFNFFFNFFQLFLGLFLSDLTFIEEGNPDKLKDSGYVNFQKCRMVADVIRQVVRFQQKPYNLMPVESISKWLLSHTPVPEKELFDLSLKAEPREPQTT